MIVLAIDCAATLCAACVYDADAGRELGRKVIDLGKGHAEHLMAVIAEALEDGGVGYSDLGRIGVATGPGSFTGLRVGVATARGLALALKVPAVGVTTLEALAEQAREGFPCRSVLVALDGGRGEIHAALYDGTAKLRHGPVVMSLEEAAQQAAVGQPVLAGAAAKSIADAAARSFDIGPLTPTADIATYARLTASKAPGERPKPLYLREADAKPQAGFILPRTGA